MEQKHKQFTIYDEVTGEIIVTGNGDDSSINLYLKPGRKVTYEKMDFADSYVKDDKPVKLPSRPDNPYVTFDYKQKAWRDQRTTDQAWADVRTKRSELLASSDWTQMPDVPAQTKQAWAGYRQELRDITKQSDPFNVEWPVKPV